LAYLNGILEYTELEEIWKIRVVNPL
jgi:hypothetical protein